MDVPPWLSRLTFDEEDVRRLRRSDGIFDRLSGEVVKFQIEGAVALFFGLATTSLLAAVHPDLVITYRLTNESFLPWAGSVAAVMVTFNRCWFAGLD